MHRQNRGTEPGVDMIYLVMTGPGVPQCGSRMDSSVSPVITGDPETFTQVPIEGDRWNYHGRQDGFLAGLRRDSTPCMHRQHQQQMPFPESLIQARKFFSDNRLRRGLSSYNQSLLGHRLRSMGNIPETLRSICPISLRVCTESIYHFLVMFLQP